MEDAVEQREENPEYHHNSSHIIPNNSSAVSGSCPYKVTKKIRDMQIFQNHSLPEIEAFTMFFEE